MRQVQRSGRVLLDAPVQRSYAGIAHALVVGIVGQQQTSAAEAILGLED